jgi:RloB-like protein
MSGGVPKPWWQEAKELSLARKAALPSRLAFAKPGDAFLIVTEGQVTEPVYFELLRASLQLSTVTVKIQPASASYPTHVIDSAATEVERLSKRRKRKEIAINEVEKYDHVWAVIDTDVAVRKDVWSDIVQYAASKGVKLAHSTPCFEFWLLLHIQGYTTRADLLNGTLAKDALEKALGRDCSTNAASAKSAIPIFLPEWPKACHHAQRVRQHHLSAGTLPPGNPSTEVDHLVCALNDAALAHHRKLKP